MNWAWYCFVSQPLTRASRSKLIRTTYNYLVIEFLLYLCIFFFLQLFWQWESRWIGLKTRGFRPVQRLDLLLWLWLQLTHIWTFWSIFSSASDWRQRYSGDVENMGIVAEFKESFGVELFKVQTFVNSETGRCAWILQLRDVFVIHTMVAPR